MFAQKWREGNGGAIPHAPEMDEVLQSERLDGRAKRTHEMRADDLPDGTVIAIDDRAFALRGDAMLRWTPSGYAESKPRPRGRVSVLTPPSIIAILRAGYQPRWHPNAD